MEFAQRLAEGIRLEAEDIVCPVDFSEWVPFVERSTQGMDLDALSYDQDGVLVFDMSSVDPEAGYQYRDLAIGNFAVRLYGDIVADRNPDALDMLQAQADWLVENGNSSTYDGYPFTTLPEDFDRPVFAQEAPLRSAYAQGVVLPGLIGAWCATGDERYREAAELSLAAFVVPMAEGGLTTWIEEDAAWFEEAAYTDGPSSRILSGHIGTLGGLWATARWAASSDAQALLDAGARAIRQEMHLLDPGFLSTYSQWAVPGLFPVVAHTSGINFRHTVQLDWLFDITGDPAFLEEALQIARYDDPTFEAVVSGTVSGNPELPYHGAAIDNWVATSGGSVEWTLDREQSVEGVTLWSKDPETRPDSYQVELLRSGEEPIAFDRQWPTGCKDTYLPLPDVPADQVRVTLQSDESSTVGLRAVGLHRNAGDPSAVARFMYHQSGNRPAAMYDEGGWIYPPSEWVVLDLQDTFSNLELEFLGWTGVELPDLQGGATLGDLSPVQFEETRDGDTLYVRVYDVDVRFLRVAFPGTGYAAKRRMWARSGPPGPDVNPTR